MANAGQDVLLLTLSGLERGMSVQHIANFQLCTCTVQDDVPAVLNEEKFKGFDQIGVLDNGCLVGVLERGQEVYSGPVSDQMRRLDSSILISADAPLSEFIQIAFQDRYRLVLSGSEINGIVTRSDLLKLPVRLYVFTLATHLELVMVELIQHLYPDGDNWTLCLSEERRAKVVEKWNEHKRRRLDPPLIEFTDFADKRTVLKKTLQLNRPLC